MSNTILLDADGVLLNWLDTFCEDHDLTRDEFFQLDKAYPEDNKKHIARFNETARIGFLPPIAGAVEGVAALKNLGYEIQVVTSFGTSPYAVRLREDNLKRIFGDVFTRIHCLPLWDNKQYFLKKTFPEKDYFFVEDSIGNAEKALEIGLQPIIFTQSWNANKPLKQGMTRTYNWKDLIETLKVT